MSKKNESSGKKAAGKKGDNLGPPIAVWVDDGGNLYQATGEGATLTPIEGKTLFHLSAQYHLEQTSVKLNGKTLYYARRLPEQKKPLDVDML